MTQYKHLAGAATCAALLSATPAFASSHREAPLLSEDPAADGTDLYVFRSPGNDARAVANSVTFIANYWPMEEPGSGPNFPRFSDNVLYEIKIDNDGDAKEDIVYQVRFRTELRKPGSFQYATGPIISTTDPALQVLQRFTVTRIDKSGRKVLLENQPVAPVMAGDFTMANYNTVLASTVYDMGSSPAVHGRAFAGPRDDPFFADLGALFDAARLRCADRPNDATGCGAGGTVKGVDFLAGYNVHSIALQIPIYQLTADGANAPTGKNAILGVWTTASRPRVTMRRAPSLAAASAGVRSQDGVGQWVQVSRVGLPLVNEVLVPVGLKDFYNTTAPGGDAALFASAQGQPLLHNPELATMLKSLYQIDVPAAGRSDLMELLQFHVRTSESGNPVGAFRGKDLGLVAADVLRIDLSRPAPANLTDNPLAAAGVVFGGANDPNIGFPNGRRPHDDVVDILETFVSGKFRGKGALLSDGVDRNDRPLLGSFPYLAPPWSGSSVGVAGTSNPRLHQALQGAQQ